MPKKLSEYKKSLFVGKISQSGRNLGVLVTKSYYSQREKKPLGLNKVNCNFWGVALEGGRKKRE